ncbi:hypothetical protein HPP92_010251 [Vanilla planifolia]|uniref:Uncharacterized protein n=1 Tax=Vanilla planifolia TaxID=51239 RepID=A0A835UZJ1_VANPL|nr:hypothetical protein HPP92_010251 [Vanilla planifolia]
MEHADPVVERPVVSTHLATLGRTAAVAAVDRRFLRVAAIEKREARLKRRESSSSGGEGRGAVRVAHRLRVGSGLGEGERMATKEEVCR